MLRKTTKFWGEDRETFEDKIISRDVAMGLVTEKLKTMYSIPTAALSFSEVLDRDRDMIALVFKIATLYRTQLEVYLDEWQLNEKEDSQ